MRSDPDRPAQAITRAVNRAYAHDVESYPTIDGRKGAYIRRKAKPIPRRPRQKVRHVAYDDIPPDSMAKLRALLPARLTRLSAPNCCAFVARLDSLGFPIDEHARRGAAIEYIRETLGYQYVRNHRDNPVAWAVADAMSAAEIGAWATALLNGLSVKEG